MSSWTDRPDAPRLIVSALHEGDTAKALELLGEKGGPAYAEDVLNELALGIAKPEGDE